MPITLARTTPAPFVLFALPADVVPEVPPLEVPEPEDPDVPDVPEVPPDTEVALPGRLTVAWLARAWKAARVLFVEGLCSR